jgi:hypothetical protein
MGSAPSFLGSGVNKSLIISSIEPILVARFRNLLIGVSPMPTFLVSPPSCHAQFEIEAEDHLYNDIDNTIVFRDRDNLVIASYIALPGTVIREKEARPTSGRMN